jgi:hypothetical protein
MQKFNHLYDNIKHPVILKEQGLDDAQINIKADRNCSEQDVGIQGRRCACSLTQTGVSFCH